MNQAQQANHKTHEQILSDSVEEGVNAGFLRDKHEEEGIEESENNRNEDDNLLLVHLLEFFCLERGNVHSLHLGKVELENKASHEHECHE